MWWRKRLDKTDKVSWPLINSTECATRTTDKDTAVLHSRRLNDSTLRGAETCFYKKCRFLDFNDNDIRDLNIALNKARATHKTNSKI